MIEFVLMIFSIRTRSGEDCSGAGRYLMSYGNFIQGVLLLESSIQELYGLNFSFRSIAA
jgi:hypothetical protein